MNTQRFKPNLPARLVVALLCLDFASASVARAQPSIPFRPLHLRNKIDVTNSLANAWQQAQQMKYDPKAWPGAALPRTTGPSPLVATLNTNNWEWLGPGNIGGRTRSILIHPTQPGTMWVGSVGGGVWKTTNNAASFSPCDDWMGNLAVSCMALDQINPNVLYAGTGEGFNNADAIPGAGVFKSYDGGASWKHLDNSLLNDYLMNRLVISPTNDKVLLAATSYGIARSTDAGTNWTTSYLSGAVLDIAFSPTNGMRCIAAGTNLPGGLALYSTNGGITWTSASGVAANGRIELAYAASNPNIVYASQDTNKGTLWISTDGGITYTVRNTGSNYLGTQGWYANCLWVDPTSESNLVVGGLDLWRSTDAGATFTKISDWTVNENNNAMVSVHADHHAIVSAPGFDGVSNTTVYFGNDGGLYCATNIYTVTINDGWSNLNHNLGITQPYGIAANPTTFTTIIGSQDNGSSQWTPSQGTSWRTWGGGDGGFCAADPTDPNYFYGEYVYLQIYRSTNAALSQSYIYGGISEAGTPAGYDDDDPDAPHSANFIAPFVLDPNNPNTMLAGASNLWRSVNVKAPTPTWTCITTNNPNPRLDLSFISAIAVTPGNSDVIWIGYGDGVLFITTNGTGAYPKWTRKSPFSGYACTGLAIDPDNPQTVYACFSGAVNTFFRTIDGGTTWTNLSAGLPAAALHSVVVAPFNSNYIYVGSDLGVFGSADQGVTWSPANEGPANVQVRNLAWARNYLLAATHGRGAYRIALGPPTVVITPASLTKYVGSSATFSASVVSQPTLGFQWTYDGNGIFGANSASLTLTNLQTTNSGVYTLWASNSFGAGSSAITLTVVDSPPYYVQAVAAGPVAYWRLNETSGTTAYDSVGGYDGTNNGRLVLGVGGPAPPEFPGFESSNTAYQFDGITTSVGLPSLYLNTNTVTLTAWVNPKGNSIQGHYQEIFSWQGGGNENLELLLGNTNNALWADWNGNLLSSTLLVPTNQWTFVALVISPTNAVIYMATNSTLASWASSEANGAAAFDSASYIGIGPSGSFSGDIDQVTIYSQSLTAAQIADQLAGSQALLPVVTLAAPANGSSLVALSNIVLTASVTTNGHNIGKVQFYNSSILLGESAIPPYQATLSGATAGPFTLLAQALYDGNNVVSSLPVNITVTNLPPTPVNDITNTVENTAVTIDVLANDTDPYNFPLTIQSVTHPQRGTAVIAGTEVIYTPFDYWFGVDNFDYTVNDGFGATASASVTVTTPFPVFTSTYSNALFNLAPIAYWRLNETSGTTAFDLAGGHDGTNNGSLLQGVSGPAPPQFPGFEAAHSAYQFDGTDTSISFPALNISSSNFTITAWVKSSGFQTANAGIVSWGGTDAFWFGFSSYANNWLNYERNSFSYTSGFVVPTNQWAFVALVLGPATNSGALYMATNSTLVSSPISLYSFSSAVITLFTNTAFLGDNNGHYFNGAMDEVAIFNKALTSTQIGDLIGAALTGVPSVAMTAPVNGSSFNAASNITLKASVITNGNHTIDMVQFYDTNATLLGEVVAPPYSFLWSNMQAGNYSIFARAKYDGSGSVDSAPVSLTITNSGSITGEVTGVVNPGGFPVMTGFSGTPGDVFYVQRSTNLVSWTTILTTNAPVNGLFICTDNFSDLAAPPPYAFYRLGWAP